MLFTKARRAARVVVLAALPAVMPGTAAAAWHRVDSPNFIVIGDVRAEALRDIALQFEAFREALGRVLSAEATATPVPTVVIVFPDERAFTPYQRRYRGKPVTSSGTFYSSRDVNYIAIVNDRRPGALRVVFHEYAHLVVANVAMNLPAWLNEGLAEYYSTFELSDGGREALIGRPIDPHLRLLNGRAPLPLGELLAVTASSALYNEGERRSVFYAQAWALTHMLLLGEPSRADRLASFIRQRRAGRTEAEAWRDAFGGLRIDRELDVYVRQPTFKAVSYRFTEGLAASAGKPAQMPDADVRAFLASLHVRQERHGDAERLIAPALQADADHPLANVVTAAVESARGEQAAAAARLARLHTNGDWFAAYLAGAALTDLVHDQQPAADSQVAAARAHLETVSRQREVPNALAHLAMLSMLAPGRPAAGVRTMIERARRLAPGRDDYALIHARVLAAEGEYAAAREILAPMLAPGYPDAVRETARTWVGAIVRMEGVQRAGAAEAPASRTHEPAAGPPVPNAPARPAFRATMTGESRLHGTLERIECPPRAAVTLHVKTDAAIGVLQAPSLKTIEFITYRTDLTGKVTCGFMKTPAPVYVTWRDGPKPGVKLVVAVEFLPLR